MRFVIPVCVIGLFLASCVRGADPQPAAPRTDAATLSKRVAALERELAALRKEVRELRRQLKPGVAAAPEKVKDIVAWGKAVKNLQAGLRYSASKSKVSLGEFVSCEVVVRNVGKQAVRVPYVEPSAFLGTVTKDKQLLLHPVGIGHGFEVTRTLQPGKEIRFSVSLLLLSPHPTGSPARPWVEISPGKYRLSSRGVLMRRDGSGSKLATGFVEIEVLAPRKTDP
jgi:hypothetical protein